MALKALKERRAWTSDEVLDLDIVLPRLAYLAGGIDANEYRRLRDEWLHSGPRPPGEVWADMQPPMLAGEYAEDWIKMDAESYADAASELARVGRLSDAILHANAAANECLVLSGVGYLRGQLAPAKAYDAAGDISNACKRYIPLRDRLRKSPRSTTLHFAERRIRELSCKDDGINEPSTRMSSNHLPSK